MELSLCMVRLGLGRFGIVWDGILVLVGIGIARVARGVWGFPTERALSPTAHGLPLKFLEPTTGLDVGAPYF